MLSITNSIETDDHHAITHEVKISSRLSLGLLLTTLLAAAPNALAKNGKVIRHVKAVPQAYIVVFDDSVERQRVEALAHGLAARYDVTIPHAGKAEAIFRWALKGFAGTMSDAAAAAIANEPEVAFVEQDMYVEMSSTTRTLTDNRQWNLDRIDQYAAIMDSQGNYVGDHQYTYTQTGAGVYVYVLDGGVQASHPEFAPGQVVAGPGFAEDPYPATNPCGGTPPDCDYFCYWAGTHGTAVASVIGGQNVGVAPGVKIVPIKIAPCTNQYQTRLQYWCWGADWIASSCVGDIQLCNPYTKSGSVANMSVAIDSTSPWDTQTPISSFESAIQNVIAAGVTVVVSANNNGNANCTTSPARLSYNNYDPVEPRPVAFRSPASDHRWWHRRTRSSLAMRRLERL